MNRGNKKSNWNYKNALAFDNPFANNPNLMIIRPDGNEIKRKEIK